MMGPVLLCEIAKYSYNKNLDYPLCSIFNVFTVTSSFKNANICNMILLFCKWLLTFSGCLEYFQEPILS